MASAREKGHQSQERAGTCAALLGGMRSTAHDRDAVRIKGGRQLVDRVLGNLVTDAGLVARVRRAQPTAEEVVEAKSPSMWAVVARSEADLGEVVDDVRWQTLSGNAGARVWTDDYSNILSVIRW